MAPLDRRDLCCLRLGDLLLLGEPFDEDVGALRPGERVEFSFIEVEQAVFPITKGCAVLTLNRAVDGKGACRTFPDQRSNVLRADHRRARHEGAHGG